MAESGSPNYIGTKLTALAREKSSGSTILTKSTGEREVGVRFAVCVNNDGYPASLELHKIYRMLPDEDAAADGDLRVVDESGEDYLYSMKRFVVVDLPQTVEQSLLRGTRVGER